MKMWGDNFEFYFSTMLKSTAHATYATVEIDRATTALLAKFGFLGTDLTEIQG
jgi:hypothetical protein